MKVYYDMAQIISEIGYTPRDAAITQARLDTVKDLEQAEMAGKAFQNIKPHTRYSKKGGKIRTYAAKYARDSRAAMRRAMANYKKGAKPRSFEPRPNPSDPYDPDNLSTEHRVYYDMAHMIAEITYSKGDEPIMNARARLKKFNKKMDQASRVMGNPKSQTPRRQAVIAKAMEKGEDYAFGDHMSDKEEAGRKTSFEKGR